MRTADRSLCGLGGARWGCVLARPCPQQGVKPCFRGCRKDPPPWGPGSRTPSKPPAGAPRVRRSACACASSAIIACTSLVSGSRSPWRLRRGCCVNHREMTSSADQPSLTVGTLRRIRCRWLPITLHESTSIDVTASGASRRAWSNSSRCPPGSSPVVASSGNSAFAQRLLTCQHGGWVNEAAAVLTRHVSSWEASR